MGNHQNRSKRGNRDRNPAPSEIRAAREMAGITLERAAILVHTEIRTFQHWETEPGLESHRRMHAAFWELFLRKCLELQEVRIDIKKRVYFDNLLNGLNGKETK